jgi:hypothetical protein
VFAKHTQLPPARKHDHGIQLLSDAKPVNARPYSLEG